MLKQPTNKMIEEHLRASEKVLKRLLADKGKARAFLKGAGIIDANGKLAKPYR